MQALASPFAIDGKVYFCYNYGMTITWFGQSCFRIECKEGSILIDPFDKAIGLKPPRIKDDVVLVTHPHFDHDNIEAADGETFVITNPGEYEIKNIHVQGIPSFHDKSQGSERGLNTIYRIKAEDMVLCHLGDFGEGKLSDEQVEAVGDVDILIVPVGGHFTIDAKEAIEIISQVEPKIVIPMHYQVPGLTIKELEGPEKFIKELGLTPETTDKFKIASKTLPIEEMKLVMLTL
jgi:L-ascorbate metabolism protein UlaG (beta-lactamase superfamily)